MVSPGLPQPSMQFSRALAWPDQAVGLRKRGGTVEKIHVGTTFAKLVSDFLTKPRVARAGPLPTLTRRTPRLLSSGTEGTPLVARMLIGQRTCLVISEIVCESIAPTGKKQSAPALL